MDTIMTGYWQVMSGAPVWVYAHTKGLISAVEGLYKGLGLQMAQAD